MKITVIGAGAMGCVYGGLLAEAGHDVVFVDVWKEHVQAINDKGLYISGVSGDRIIPARATETVEYLPCQDLILIMVKSAFTADAAGAARRIAGPHSIILTLQNGLGNAEIIASIVGEKSVVGGTTSHGAYVLGPGTIRHAGGGHTQFAEYTGGLTPRVENLAKAFTEAGLPATALSSTDGPVWSKLLVNVGINALATILRVKNGALAAHPAARKLLVKAVEEGSEVAAAKGIRLVYDDPVGHCIAVAEETGDNICSMLQDAMARRKTEIDVMNGAIMREGEKLGIPTPVNSMLVQLIKAGESLYQEQV